MVVMFALPMSRFSSAVLSRIGASVRRALRLTMLIGLPVGAGVADLHHPSQSISGSHQQIPNFGNSNVPQTGCSISSLHRVIEGLLRVPRMQAWRLPATSVLDTPIRQNASSREFYVL